MGVAAPLPWPTLTPRNVNVLPLVGEVAAGAPVVAEDRIEDMVAVPDQLCADADFVLTVKGESMIDAGILPGDLVVVRKQDDARNGEIVVALWSVTRMPL